MWTDIVSPFAVVFIENNGVKNTLLRCSTTRVNASPMLKACLGPRVWYVGVPTHFNIAGALLRLAVQLASQSLQCLVLAHVVLVSRASCLL